MTASRLAWGLWLLTVLLIVPGPVLSYAMGGAAGDALFLVAVVAVQIGASTGGAVVASRQPGNAVGWIFLTLGAGFALAFFANSWAELGLDTDSGPLPLDELAAWLGHWLVLPVLFGPTMLLLFLFPTGRSVSARWRRVMWADMALLAVATLALACGRGWSGRRSTPCRTRSPRREAPESS
jgi:hypothetical protein